MKLSTIASLITATLVSIVAAQQPNTGNHPDWPRWCGKVYESGYPSFEPGGETLEPVSNGSTYLHMQFKPRYSLYLSSEKTASFVVNAALSPWYGEAYSQGYLTSSSSTNELEFSITLGGGGATSYSKPLVTNQKIGINETGREYSFSLTGLKPSRTPYSVVLSGKLTTGSSKQRYTATSSLLYLPDNPAGSATKIDHLKGGLLFKNAQTNQQFTPLLPYGYYGLYNGSNSTAASEDFVKNYTSSGYGLNAIISLAGYADTNPVYNSMDEHGLRFMFDLRGSYKNLTDTQIRVNTIKNHTSLFAYWTGDEPDGWEVPFNITPAATDLIHHLDPYHPVAVTLNCQNYYFGAYSIGADILMEDVYPIGINATFSKWNTTCNTTLGDCGCDNCAGNVQDVPSRLDDLARYEEWLGRWPLPKFHNPQVFSGEGYWARDPTPDEARAMNALAFNRGATGIFGWTWPSSAVLFDTHANMSHVVTNEPVRSFLLSGKPQRLSVAGYDLLDAAYWVVGDKALVSVVWGAYEKIQKPVSIDIPGVEATDIESVAFGGLSWQLSDGNKLTIKSLPAMSTSLILLNLKS
ncbi:hypothetical protein F5Y16DRAFT_332763 [Xylariaceae sp. FL0255]|nr:hypothetical protein F5Y16DRAFT_332763 [Xylariaceae sp. FL0255]